MLEEDNGCSFAMTVLDLGQVLFSHGKIACRNRKLKAYAVWLQEGDIVLLSVFARGHRFHLFVCLHCVAKVRHSTLARASHAGRVPQFEDFFAAQDA